jgi:hypothetical protein
MTQRTTSFPVGAAVTEAQLDDDLHGTLARLRAVEPVSWVPALEAWVVTARDQAVEVMRDASAFTVDDPRFSTAQVLGPSMLSLDGPAHTRHRDPFADAFRLPEVRTRLNADVHSTAVEMVRAMQPTGTAELRRQLAGPLAVRVVARALDLIDGDPATLLAWYEQIVASVTAISNGHADDGRADEAVAHLTTSVQATVRSGTGVLSAAIDSLTIDEVVSNTGVMLFGGIETSEGMTTNAFAHLLADGTAWDMVVADPTLIANVVEESLRDRRLRHHLDRGSEPRSGDVRRTRPIRPQPIEREAARDVRARSPRVPWHASGAPRDTVGNRCGHRGAAQPTARPFCSSPTTGRHRVSQTGPTGRGLEPAPLTTPGWCTGPTVSDAVRRAARRPVRPPCMLRPTTRPPRPVGERPPHPSPSGTPPSRPGNRPAGCARQSPAR